VLTKQLERKLLPNARRAAEVCKRMGVDPGTYVDAQVMYAPIIRGYPSLTPEQLCSKDSMIYVQDFIALRGTRHYDREFETECGMLALCLENGWSEQLALYNSTFDFSPYFRILITAERDENIIKQYGNLASQILRNDPELVKFLKTVKSKEGKGLDFSRIPNFKYE
jgi:hypothetical protein